MFDLTVSETGEYGSVALALPGADMPFTIHVFSKERIELWQAASDSDRAEAAASVVLTLHSLAMTGLSDAEAAAAYNILSVSQGVDDVGVTYDGE